MRTLGKRVEGNFSRVQIPHPPPALARRSRPTPREAVWRPRRPPRIPQSKSATASAYRVVLAKARPGGDLLPCSLTVRLRARHPALRSAAYASRAGLLLDASSRQRRQEVSLRFALPHIHNRAALAHIHNRAGLAHIHNRAKRRQQGSAAAGPRARRWASAIAAPRRRAGRRARAAARRPGDGGPASGAAARRRQGVGEAASQVALRRFGHDWRLRSASPRLSRGSPRPWSWANSPATVIGGRGSKYVFSRPRNVSAGLSCL